jgi:hypothetical protein
MSAASLCLSAGRYPPHRIWTHKYPQIARAVESLGARQAYLDGELCGLRADGITSFSMVQLASDAGNAAGPVFFLFDLLHLDGEGLTARPLIERKARLADLLSSTGSPSHFSDHPDRARPGLLRDGVRPGGRRHRVEARGCAVCPRQSRPVAQGQMPQPGGVRGDRLDRSRRRAAVLGALLLGYYDPNGRLTYAGRVGTGIWTEDNLLRQVVYEGCARTSRLPDVRRAAPYPKADGAAAATKK